MTPEDGKQVERLERRGYYEIPEAAGNNPLPDRDLTPNELTQLWDDLIACWESKKTARSNAIADGALEWGYHAKIEIKTQEAVIALLHGVIAPDAEFLCARGCPHLERGMTADQVKRVLDALDAYRRTKDYESDENYIAERGRNALFDFFVPEKIHYRNEQKNGVLEVVRLRPAPERVQYLVRWPDAEGRTSERFFESADQAMEFVRKLLPT